MVCNSCSTGKDGQPKGCKNNGTCGTDSCNKLTVFDWLANMSLPDGQEPFDWVEVRFKNGRKHYYKNTEKLTLSIGDVVATQAQFGHDVGVVTLTGELVRIQMKRKKVSETGDEVFKIYRKASQKDIDIWSEYRDKEEPMKVKARQFAIEIKLQMKISDIEFQGDGSKATFYYTAEDRVDFRELIKMFAKEFKTRIEMKQVGFRQEASRLGGIGSCGRELCCSTWLTDFRSVSTSAARYQQLSLNPQKLAGQCGKLKCCLNYELDMYIDELKDFPSTEIKLYTKKGSGIHIKTDVFKRLMWYLHQTDDKSGPNLVALSPERVKEIIALNKEKKNPEDLKDFDESTFETKAPDYADVLGQDDLSRFDKKFTKKKKRKGGKRKPNGKAGEKKNTTSKGPKATADGNSKDVKSEQKPKPKGKRPPRKQSNAKGKPTGQKSERKPTDKKSAPKGAPEVKGKPVEKKPRPKKRPPRKPNDANKPTNKGKNNNEKKD